MSTGLGKYFGANFLEDNAKMYVLLTIFNKEHYDTHCNTRYATWIPGDFIIYAVPMWLRLPTKYVRTLSFYTHTYTHTLKTTYSHALSFLWTCYLSFLRGDAIDEEEIKEYRNLEAWLSLSTNDLLNQDADAIDQFFKKIDLDKNGKITITELRSALAQKILIEDLDEGADVERAEIRKSIMNSLMVSTLGT